MVTRGNAVECNSRKISEGSHLGDRDYSLIESERNGCLSEHNKNRTKGVRATSLYLTPICLEKI